MTSEAGDRDAIAIVGMAGHFPAAPDIARLWRLLDEGQEATRWLTDEELLAAGERSEVIGRSNYIKAAMMLPDMEKFDANFFGFTPREAAILDPQHRHFLECCWEALEDAGCAPEKFPGAIGVFGGCGMQAYWAHNLLTNPDLVEQVGMFLLRHTGNDKDFLTTRVSYLLNLNGPSVGVQTACSTSLVAVHLACQSLMSGECDLALAGGSSIEVPHGRGYLHAEGEILSSNGHCRAFDDAADGTLFGSGAGVVALQRLGDALKNGFGIRAIIRGSAVNNDGANKAGYFAPSVVGQARAAAEALAVAEVDPSSVDYVEAHGTGTLVGDPIELTALQQAYRGVAPGMIGIGSIKTNIGHLDTAAGVASLIKATLALQNERVPKSLNFSKPNSRFDFKNSPFRVVAEGRAWPRGPKPRRAGVNSLGVGGTNAHVILEEGPLSKPTPDGDNPHLILLSAKSAASLQALVLKWVAFMKHPPDDFSAADAAYTTQIGRTPFAHRRALVASDGAELAGALSASVGLGAAGIAPPTPPRVVWMFPGGGSQYPGLAGELYRTQTVFRDAVDECFAAMPSAPGDLIDLMIGEGSDARAEALRRPLYSVLAVFILEYAMGKLWLSWGAKPDAVLGHSAGEYAAAVFSGVMSLEDALSTIALRGEIFETAPQGGMLVVKADEGRVRALARETLDVAAVNGPQLTVVSGEEHNLAVLARQLADENIETAPVHINVAAHSRMLDPYLLRFRAHVERLKLQAPKIRFISTLTGGDAREDEVRSPDYWARQLRQPVRFSEALRAACDQPGTILLEVGPGQTLGALASLHDGPIEPSAIVSSTQGIGADDARFILQSAATLWAHGVDLDFQRVRSGAKCRRISLPTYAFEKQRHWIDPGEGAMHGAPAVKHTLKRAPLEEWISVRSWRLAPLGHPTAVSTATWLVFGDDTAVSEALEAAIRTGGSRPIVVRRARQFSEHDGDRYAINPEAPGDYVSLLQAIAAKGQSPTIIVHLWSMNAPPLQFEQGRPRLPLGFDSLLALTKAIQLCGWEGPLRVCAVTSGAVAAGGDKPVHPERAAMLGPCRVAPRETPGVAGQVLDLEVDHDPDRAAEIIVGEATASSVETMVAYRAGARFVEVLDSIQTTATTRLRQGGVYLITGGLGDLGLALARFLATRFGANLVLVGAHGFPNRRHWRALASTGGPRQARRARVLLELDALGVKVLVLQGDVADRKQMARVIAATRARFGEIHGVIHAAGRVDDAPIALKELDAAWAVMAPKVAGGLILNELLPEGALDFFAVFSSVSVHAAPAGQVDYVAANAVLDALTSARTDGLSIAWGPWADIGMAARLAGELEPNETLSHPLLGQRAREERDGTVRFQASFDPGALWVLSEHVVDGCGVVPGSGLVEMANAAASQLGLGPSISLSNANFPAALVLARPATRAVRTSVQPLGASEWRIEVESRRSPGEDWTLHFTARMTSDPLRVPRAPRSRVAQMTAVDAARLTMADRNIEFGPRWRSVKRAATSVGSVEIEIELADEFVSDLDTYCTHPALLDVAWAAGLFLLRMTGDAVYAPISFRRLDQFAPLPRHFKAYVDLKENLAGAQSSFDVELVDEHGQVVVEIEEITFRSIHSSGLADMANAPLVLRADASTFEQSVALGIRQDEADALFERVFAQAERNIVVSSIAPASLLAANVLSRPVSAPDVENDAFEADDYASGVEAKIAKMCCDILGVRRVGPDDELLSFGGGSLAGVRLFARIGKELGVDLALSALFQAPTLRALARLVEESTGPADPSDQTGGSLLRPRRAWSPLVQISAGAAGWPALFCVHGGGGNVVDFRPLAERLPRETPLFGLQAQGVDGRMPFLDTIEKMAKSYVDAIQTVDANGPYRLAGYSGGGVIAFEMAQLLLRAGAEIELLAMFDTLAPAESRKRVTFEEKLRALPQMSPKALINISMGLCERLARAAGIERAGERHDLTPLEIAGARSMEAYKAAQARYEPQSYAGDILLFRASHTTWEHGRAGQTLGWERLVGGRIQVVPVVATHNTVFHPPAVDVIAREMSSRLVQASLPTRTLAANRLADV